MVFYLANLCAGGVLQLLVHREEVLHLVEDMPGQLGDVLVIVVSGVVKGDGDDFLILAAAVVHDDDADGVAPHQGHGDDVLRAEHQHVQGVAVVSVGAGDKAVVGRVVGGGVQHPVQP